ncbi:ClpP/crotonase-like domain-containing protein [Sporodiniella umbellata]|nr:ClpP/crotonase-like domain-containing protein [Sporodiniella umbellata]
MSFPKTEYVQLSTPESHVLLITIDREKQYNALNFPANYEMERVIDWAEEEESIWCIVITGKGTKAFCTGMDLVSAHESKENPDLTQNLPPTGFGGISNRRMSRKPIIAAVNGFALGGGMEMVCACNVVVATEKSKFGLPEVKQGVVIGAGGLSRIARSVSYQVASELVLTGRFMEAKEAYQHGLVNKVVSNDTNIVDAALVFARQIIANSPDAVFLTKQGLLLSLEKASVTDATNEWLSSPEADAWKQGDNLAEGLQAFAEKRKPQWKNPSKL